jgi:hypothetical protein
MKNIEKDLAGLTQKGFVNLKGISGGISEQNSNVIWVRPLIRKYFHKSDRYNYNHTSYGIKKIFQRYTDRKHYISNGEFIYAMALEGFKIKRDDINCRFNIYEKEYQMVNTAPKLLKELRDKSEKYDLQEYIDYLPTKYKYKYNLKYLFRNLGKLTSKEKRYIVSIISKEINVDESILKRLINLEMGEALNVDEEKIISQIASLIDCQFRELVNIPQPTNLR